MRSHKHYVACCAPSLSLATYIPSVSYKRTSTPFPFPLSGVQGPCVRGHSKTMPVLLTAAFTAVPLGAPTTILYRGNQRERMKEKAAGRRRE